MAERIIAACGGSRQGKTMAVLGLTFKPNTDDMRDSPSLVILPALQGEGATIRAFDPEGMHEARQADAGRRPIASDAYDAHEGADALVILTEWNEFRGLDLAAHAAAAAPARSWSTCATSTTRPRWRQAGFAYSSIGRPRRSRPRVAEQDAPWQPDDPPLRPHRAPRVRHPRHRRRAPSREAMRYAVGRGFGTMVRGGRRQDGLPSAMTGG